MKFFDLPHEHVAFYKDEAAGLKTICAIHNTRLGPSLGGVRMRAYASEEEALTDVLRLAEAMTLKAAASGLPLGGGKAVIIGDPARDKTPALFKAFGRFVEKLSGDYITAEDSGTTQEDMAFIASQTQYATGKPRPDGKRGDPGPPTARGLFHSIPVALEHVGKSSDLRNAHVALQGAGSVGSELARLLSETKAKLTVADIDPDRAKNIAQKYGATVVDANKIHTVEADVFSPCGLGAVLNDETIPQIRAKIVLGAANNQLLDSDKHSAMLAKRGILYAPDYVVNAGGIIQIWIDDLGGRKNNPKGISVEKVGETLRAILEIAKKRGCTPEDAAQQLAADRIAGKA